MNTININCGYCSVPIPIFIYNDYNSQTSPNKGAMHYKFVTFIVVKNIFIISMFKTKFKAKYQEKLKRLYYINDLLTLYNYN